MTGRHGSPIWPAPMPPFRTPLPWSPPTRRERSTAATPDEPRRLAGAVRRAAPAAPAAPVTVYVEQFSAHPLEADAAELYGPPDGYIDSAGQVHKERQSADDKPVYEVELRPEDGLYPLPYMATQADGAAWDEECAFPGAPEAKARQGFFPDGSRSFEEIDRLQIGENGTGNLISAKAEIDFYRILPPSGYTKGLPADRRTDTGAGDIPAREPGRRFLPLQASAPRGLGAADCSGARHQCRAADPGERQI